MKLRPLNMDKIIRMKNLKEVYNHNLTGAGSLFDPNIFGYGEDRKTKMGFIRLNGKFVDPSTYIYVSRREYRDLPGIISGDIKVSIDSEGVLQKDPNGHSGLKWLYDNFGKFRFKKKKTSLDKYTREDFFVDKFMVLPQHYRDIDTTEGTPKVDELNQFYIDLLRNCKFREKQLDNPLMNTGFIDMKIQGLLVGITEYISNLTFGKTGVQRSQVMSRSVDHSSRMVLSAPEIRMKDTIGKTRTRLGHSAAPLHHLMNMFPVHVIAATQNELKTYYDLGLIPIDIEEFEIHFSDDFIKEKMKEYYYSYKDRSSYVLGPNGEKIEFDFEFKDDDGGTYNFKRGITWIELFYVALNSIKDNIRIQHTRFPVTDKGSFAVCKIEILSTNTNKGDLKISHNGNVLYDLKDFCNITPYIERPNPTVYEEVLQVSNLILDGMGGDYDGDKMTNRGIYSKEAVEEIDNYNNTPLSVCSVGGSNKMKVGREGIQTFYDLTCKFDKDLKPEDPKLNRFLNDFFVPDRDYTLGEIVELIQKWDIYTKVTYKGNKTTLGRVIFNGVIFNHIPEHQFINDTITGKRLNGILDMYAREFMIPKKITVEQYRSILSKYHDIGFGLAEAISSPVSYNMLVKDDEVFNKKKAELMAKYNISKEVNPIDMDDFEQEMIKFSKEYYKDDPMSRLYESGAKPNWDVDFKYLKVSMGATPIIGSNKLGMITNCLKDGLTTEDIEDHANLQISGAAARGTDTEKGGYQVKQYAAAFQSDILKRGNCRSTEYLETIDSSTADLLGRTVLDGNTEVYVTPDNVHKYLNKKIKKRSPIFCKARNGVCSTCAGTQPLDMIRKDEIPLGLFVQEIGSALNNKFMKATHDMRQKLFHIESLDDYIKTSVK